VHIAVGMKMAHDINQYFIFRSPFIYVTQSVLNGCLFASASMRISEILIQSIRRTVVEKGTHCVQRCRASVIRNLYHTELFLRRNVSFEDKKIDNFKI
jgi:hypothetical protein